MQMLMNRLSLELMYQVAHSIEIAVGRLLAFSKRCPESLQRLRPVLPATLKRWHPKRAHCRVSSVVVCIFLRTLISSWVLGWLCPMAPLSFLCHPSTRLFVRIDWLKTFHMWTAESPLSHVCSK